MKANRKSIAIFDDDEDILFICKYILENEGWEVHTFNDCRNVIPKLEQSNPSVVLMDNWIPDAGGIVSTRLIKSSENFKNLPVVYFTANTQIQKLAQEAGADSYLAKPFSITEFQKIIEKQLA